MSSKRSPKKIADEMKQTTDVASLERESDGSYASLEEETPSSPLEYASDSDYLTEGDEYSESGPSGVNQPRRHSCIDHGGPSQERRPSSMEYGRKKEKNPFPPTKKYRYYPVTCEFCRKRFQPPDLKAHQQKAHPSMVGPKDKGKRVQSAMIRKGYDSSGPSSDQSKSVAKMPPRRLQICYICGRMYGSKSLKIHEPKCLDKWRIQNQELPPGLRAQEPVKPKVLPAVAENKGYDVPGFDPKAEAAYRSHLSTLIPCKHCSRTFSPDRIQKHISCCIERPRTSIRECMTPSGSGKGWG